MAGASGDGAVSNQGARNRSSSHSATPLDPGVGLTRRNTHMTSCRATMWRPSSSIKGATSMPMTATSVKNRAVQLIQVASMAPVQSAEESWRISTELFMRSSAYRSKGRCQRRSQVRAASWRSTMIARISEGAELLADGHIHVYGALRGRALAGASGDTSARIFCKRFEPDLVAIAGCYKVADAIDEGLVSRPVVVRLDNDNLLIELQE